jgi:hypothetical protein
MKIFETTKRIALTAVVVLSLGLALVPHADASTSIAPSGHSVDSPTFGGGKDGNESHG